MKLVFLYGPAAVGKLTVARELTRLTGYPIFDNHLSIDYAARLLDWGTPSYMSFLRALRLFTFRQMAQMGLKGLIPDSKRYSSNRKHQGAIFLNPRALPSVGLVRHRSVTN
jgi:hypothetical protein